MQIFRLIMSRIIAVLRKPASVFTISARKQTLSTSCQVSPSTCPPPLSLPAPRIPANVAWVIGKLVVSCDWCLSCHLTTATAGPIVAGVFPVLCKLVMYSVNRASDRVQPDSHISKLCSTRWYAFSVFSETETLMRDLVSLGSCKTVMLGSVLLTIAFILTSESRLGLILSLLG